MKKINSVLFVSSAEDGKAAVRTSLEALEETMVEAVEPAEDKVLSEAVSLIGKITDVHSEVPEVKVAAGELLKQLVIAQGVPETVISQEGLGEFITRIKHALNGRDKHGLKATDKKPGQKVSDDDAEKTWTKESEAAYKELSSNLDKYYLNDNWLSGQTFVEGDVNSADFSDLFVVAGKAMKPFEALEAIKHHVDETISKYAPLVKEFDDNLQEINKRLEELANNSSVDDDELVARTKAAVKQINNLPTPLEKLPKVPGSGMANLTLVKSGGHLVAKASSDPKGKGLKELPALDKEGVKKAAKLIKSILTYNEREMYFTEMPSYNWLDHSNDSVFNERISDADESVFFDYYDKYDYHSGPERLTYGVDELYDVCRIASALKRWIDRSIK